MDPSLTSLSTGVWGCTFPIKAYSMLPLEWFSLTVSSLVELSAVQRFSGFTKTSSSTFIINYGVSNKSKSDLVKEKKKSIKCC